MIEKIDEHTDVFFYTTKSMILQPKRRHVVLRLVTIFLSFLDRIQFGMDSQSVVYILTVEVDRRLVYEKFTAVLLP